MFHDGEVEVQSRRGVREDAERVGGIIAATIPPAVARLLANQRIAVVASLDARGRPWASVLTGQPGFIRAVDDRLLRLAAAPRQDDPLSANLKARPELGVLVIDPGTRRRWRLNGRGLLSHDGVFVLVDQAYGNCPKYIQKRRLVAESGAKAGAARSTG